jgi:hypothetical protein
MSTDFEMENTLPSDRRKNRNARDATKPHGKTSPSKKL